MIAAPSFLLFGACFAAEPNVWSCVIAEIDPEFVCECVLWCRLVESCAVIYLMYVVEMGWPDIHWLARDLGWAGGSHCVSFGQELEYAVGA